jgi:hypothetical protein
MHRVSFGNLAATLVHPAFADGRWSDSHHPPPTSGSNWSDSLQLGGAIRTTPQTRAFAAGKAHNSIFPTETRLLRFFVMCPGVWHVICFLFLPADAADCPEPLGRPPPQRGFP